MTSRKQEPVTQMSEPCENTLQQLRVVMHDGQRFRQKNSGTPPGAPRGEEAIIAEAAISNICEGAGFTVSELRAWVLGTATAEAAHAQLWRDTTAGTIEAITMTEGEELPTNADEFMDAIRRWHAPIMRGQEEMNPGEWKVHVVGVYVAGGFQPFCEPGRVEATLRAGYERVRNIEDGWIRAAATEFLTVCVHPFHDGNGRTSRVAGNHVHDRTGIGRRIIRHSMHGNYCRGLQRIRNEGDAMPWRKVLWQEHHECQSAVAPGGTAGDKRARQAGYDHLSA